MFAQDFADRGDLWDNSRADEWKPVTNGREISLFEVLHEPVQTRKTSFYKLTVMQNR